MMSEYISFFPTLTATTPEEISWETVTTTIRGDYLRQKTEQYRRALAEGDKTQMKAIKTSCPAIVCQAVLEGGRGKEHIRKYTGTFMADFDHVPKEKLAEAMKHVKADKHTLLTYVTISGEGLRVIARVDGEVTPDNYKAALLTVNEHYKKLLNLDYDTQCSSTTRMCGLAWDPDVLFQPLAKRLKINKALGKTTSARKGKGAGRPMEAKSIADKVKRLVEADGAVYADGQHNDYVSRCVYLMNRYGVTMANCTEWALEAFKDYEAKHHGTIANMVKSIYATHADEHAALALSKSRRVGVAEVEKYIKERYVVRRNLLSFQVEFMKRTPLENSEELKNEFSSVDDHFINSLWRQMENDGMEVDTKVINNILGSDFVTDYHPFKSWIESLPAWDGETDYIRQFFSLVHCKDTSEETFYFYARCWFLAMVASVMNPEVVNHEILTFIGEQGTYKSSFMFNILPPLLRDYYATKNNWYMLTKDDYIMLAENIIISLEEIDSMATKEVNQLKAFTTEPHVKQRPAYGRHIVLRPRVASLCATGNNLTFLSDQTGNRRWLPFHISHIDNPWTAHIPYEGMYAQALALVNAGERYWLDDKQIRELNERNKAYMTPDPAREMIVTYFTIPRTESETKYMTASKIAARFMPPSRSVLRRLASPWLNWGMSKCATARGGFGRWRSDQATKSTVVCRARNQRACPPDLPFCDTVTLYIIKI